MIGLLLANLTGLVGEGYQLGDELLAATSPADAIALFGRVCVAPFPDADKFVASVGEDKAGFSKVDSAEVGSMRGGEIGPSFGDVWASRNFNVRYMASLAPSLPQPQCKVSVRLAAGIPHQDLANMVTEQVGWSNSFQREVGGHTRTFWDLQKPDQRWRIALQSGSGRMGEFMSLTLMQLRK